MELFYVIKKVEKVAASTTFAQNRKNVSISKNNAKVIQQCRIESSFSLRYAE